nr:MAG TPA: DNA polymerase [Caudoviricetes sp.]
MDFYKVGTRRAKNGTIEVFPDFIVKRSRDLMVRAQSFYAIWDEDQGLWSTDEYEVARIVDNDLYAKAEELEAKGEDNVRVLAMSSFGSKSWLSFRSYMSHLSDSSHQLDMHLTFSDAKIKKTDYVSKRLPYPMVKGEHEAWDKLAGTLYDEGELAKIEWAIGSIFAGEGMEIQKFLVFYGEAGTGKSTILNIIQRLFEGYYTVFDAKALASSGNTFSTEVFKNNPLVAIQHDGDLSKIEDNTKLNSIVSHEMMSMNEKYKPSYMARSNCFLFMGTNKPVMITDSKSGIIRRLIDVHPTGDRVDSAMYQSLMTAIEFELPAIADHCHQRYLEMGKHYYDSYRPKGMMLETDFFYNFVNDNYFIFAESDGLSLKRAYELYKEYCEETNARFSMQRNKFRDELASYFREYHDRYRLDDGQRVRSYFIGFRKEKFDEPEPVAEPLKYSISLDDSESLLDDILKDYPAQLASKSETPLFKWSDVKSSLKELDTTKLHYVKVPKNLIVIDFDLKDEAGNKSLERNLSAASDWPPTYTELSKSGQGIHLHYYYNGDTSELSRLYSEGIEVKVFKGNSSLRRRLSKCNKVPIATLNSGLPTKEEKVISEDVVMSEKTIRNLITRNLNKEIHPATKPSIDFIKKILDDAYSSGKPYDVSNMRPKVLAFANGSTNNSEYCVELVSKMHFTSESERENHNFAENEHLVFYDVEVFPNLFVVCWKEEGDDKQVVKLINPTPEKMEDLFSMRLVGFNNRKYDNHILYARYMGYSNAQLYELSQRLVTDSKNAYFMEAFNISYTDVYDYASKKQSLKKWEIELGIHHKELSYSWDRPVPEDRWDEVASYCANDVIATEAVHKARHADFTARQILSSISGLTVNDSTQKQTARIIFGKDRHPQDKFVYTDLSEMFEGYSYEFGKSSYRGEDPGEGGYVYAEPGMYENVALLDVESMHPSSIINLDVFGPYTKNFKFLKDARLAIKHGELDKARKMWDGKLADYLTTDDSAKDLSYALKIVINIVYGLTSAKFENPFKDPRNIDNIVAKRGALFMIDLKHFVQEKGFTVAHIKTDSIKIPNATPEIIEEVMEFGRKYGYIFDHEATYDRMCLVNESTYIAHDDEGWHATGLQFQIPYVFKTLFSHEDVTLDDMCETKSVQTSMWLNPGDDNEEESNYVFVGRVGSFVPVIEGVGGGTLLRARKEGGYSAVTGSKGYLWMQAEDFKLSHDESAVDKGFYNSLVDSAVETIQKFGDFEQFTNVN